VVVDPEQRKILLGDHIKAQLWLPTGGHVALNEHPRRTVIREAAEELAMRAVFLHGKERPLFVTVTKTVGLTAGHTDVSLWYVLRGESYMLPDFERREFTDMNWFGVDEILNSYPSIFDPHMQRFTQKLSRYLDQA
jgi:8-oxo-dGTP diphosphatase